MNKSIRDAFGKSKAFIPFITAGDPDLETTEKLILALQNAGADLIEIGIPFSDPTAEGPVIMQASQRALAGGLCTDDVLAMVSRIKDQVQIPLVFMTYANVVYSYGIERFMDGAARAGIELISMIAPTSRERIEKIAASANGFLYCVSSLGVTGCRSEIESNVEDMIVQVRKTNRIPCAIGFGIANEKQAAQMAAISDGVIVGSAIVALCAKYGQDAPVHAAKFVRSMKQAIASL